MNSYVPHLLVIPEDDANRQIANGFQSDALLDIRRMQILEEAGGWKNVLETFQESHVPGMERFSNRFIVLMIDLDEQGERLTEAKARIPGHLRDRVFILSSWDEPEKLKRSLGSFETIGRKLAKDCRDNTEETWSHEFLRHNSEELKRLREQVRPFLFPTE